MTLLRDVQIGGDVEEKLKYNRENNWPDLTGSQKIFGFEFLVLRSPTKAALAAGISAGRGYALLRHPLVSEFIKDLQKSQALRFGIDADFAIMEMLEAAEMFKGEVEVNMIDRDGDEFTGKKFHPEQYMSIIKEYNKIAGLHHDSKANQGSVTVNLDFGALGLTQAQSQGITLEGTCEHEGEIPL